MDIKLKLAGYCRVSTDNQKEEGTIELQENALRDYAGSNGYELVQIFKDEGVSGSLGNRPALVELFSFLEANEDIDGVLIHKLDRLARDLNVQETLIIKFKELNKKLISTKEDDLASDDPYRTLFRQVIGAFSQLEKAFITMRLSSGRINKARKGGYAGGGIALGYKTKDKELFKDEKWTQIIKWIFQLRFELKFGLREIARKLNKSKIPTAKGGRWHAGTIRYILNNPIYKGQLVYKTETARREDLVLITL